MFDLASSAWIPDTVDDVIIKYKRHVFPVFQTPLPEQEGPSTGSLASFELISSKDVAYHMTAYDWELFHCVHEVQLGGRVPLAELIFVRCPPEGWQHSWCCSCVFPVSILQLELLYHTFGRQNVKKTTVNLDLFLRRFNEIQFWVISEVCLCSQLSKRVQLLKKFIKIAAQWVDYTSFDSQCSIVFSLPCLTFFSCFLSQL